MKVKRYLLLEKSEDGELILHGKFVQAGQALRIVTKNKSRFDRFEILEVWEEMENE